MNSGREWLSPVPLFLFRYRIRKQSGIDTGTSEARAARDATAIFSATATNGYRDQRTSERGREWRCPAGPGAHPELVMGDGEAGDAATVANSSATTATGGGRSERDSGGSVGTGMRNSAERTRTTRRSSWRARLISGKPTAAARSSAELGRGRRRG